MSKNIFISLLSVVLFWGAAELTLRLVGEGIFSNRPVLVINPELEYPQYFKKDRILFWRFRSSQTIQSRFMVGGSYRINRHGFRGADFTEQKPAGVTRIICVGNSTTFGWGVAEESTYVYQLGRLLADSLPTQKFEVINAAVTGYSSLQGLRLLQRELPGWQADLIIACYGWNDHWPARNGIPDSQQPMPPQWALNVQNILNQTATYRFFKQELWGLFGLKNKKKGAESGFVPRVSLQEYRFNLEGIISLVRNRRVQIVFITPPAASTRARWQASDLEKYRYIWNLHNQYCEMMREVCIQSKVYCFDAAALFEQRPGFFDNPANDYLHYNAQGHCLIALNLFQLLRQHPELIETQIANEADLRDSSPAKKTAGSG